MRNADIVFVIDASSGMRPIFDSLKEHLRELLQPFRDEGDYWSLRLALLERVMEKIVKHHIALYLFAPNSAATDMISDFACTRVITPDQVDGVESDYGLNRFFKRVNCWEIAHRISCYEDAWTPWDLDEWERKQGAYEKAILGQDKWTDDCWA